MLCLPTDVDNLFWKKYYFQEARFELHIYS